MQPSKYKVTFLIPPPLDGKPPVERVFGCNYGIYPIPNIFALIAAAVLEQEGYEVRYIDAPVLKWEEKDLLSFLNNDKSDLYCFYTVNLSIDTDIITIEYIRRGKGDIPVVFMGPAPTYQPEIFLKYNNIFVIRGEMEITLKELANCILKGNGILSSIKGISYLNNGTVINNPTREILEDLDSLPFPTRHLIDRDKYYNPKFGMRPVTVMLTSRGCPHKCIYCVPNSLSFARELEYKKKEQRKPPVRKRSVENILDEFRLLKKEGYKAVSILDDQFVWGEERTVRICEGIKDLGIKWGCLARADYLNERIVRAMAKANCRFVDIGVESFDEAVLKYVKKGINSEKIKDAIMLLKENKITVKLNMLIGSSPLETKESIMRNIKIVKELDPDGVMYSIATPFPGTEFYDIAKKEGWLIYGDYVPKDVRKEAIHRYPHLDEKELQRLIRYANFNFYLRPCFILRNFGRFLNPREFYSTSVSMVRKLF
jgi:radical SAM superfamily enzyme YgiQ (UPF0313 family)